MGWALISARLNLSSANLPKDTTSPQTFHQRFKELIAENYKAREHICTGSSKSEAYVETAATTRNHTNSPSLLKISSTFPAETHAIHLALITVEAFDRRKFYMFLVWRSCVPAFQKRIPINSNVHNLKNTIADLQNSEKKVELHWIPDHTGKPGNKTADKNKTFLIATICIYIYSCLSSEKMRLNKKRKTAMSKRFNGVKLRKRH